MKRIRLHKHHPIFHFVRTPKVKFNNMGIKMKQISKIYKNVDKYNK